MKINFSKKEYQTLVEMLLVANWIIRSHEEEPQPERRCASVPRSGQLLRC